MSDSPHPNAVILSANWYGADTDGRGRGLFASRAFEAGSLIGMFAGLALSAREVDALKGTRVYDYVFYVRAAPEFGPDAFDASLALGAISLCNHSPRANARFDVREGGLWIALHAGRIIAPHEEITIDYEDFVHFEVAE
jgi:uncharacterized protein